MNEWKWTQAAREALLGRKIIEVRWMTNKEAEAQYWLSRPVMLILDDGNWIAPMMDDEGNDGGALAATGKHETWPVLDMGFPKGNLPRAHPNSDESIRGASIPDGIKS